MMMMNSSINSKGRLILHERTFSMEKDTSGTINTTELSIFLLKLTICLPNIFISTSWEFLLWTVNENSGKAKLWLLMSCNFLSVNSSFPLL